MTDATKILKKKVMAKATEIGKVKDVEVDITTWTVLGLKVKIIKPYSQEYELSKFGPKTMIIPPDLIDTIGDAVMLTKDGDELKTALKEALAAQKGK